MITYRQLYSSYTLYSNILRKFSKKNNINFHKIKDYHTINFSQFHSLHNLNFLEAKLSKKNSQ